MILFLAFVCESVSFAETAPKPGEETSAREQVQIVIDRALSVLQSDQPMDVKREKVEKVADEYFDFETIAKLSLARNWRNFSPEQRVDFVKSFRTFLSRRYGNELDRYSGERVEIVGEREEPRGDRTVLTELMRPTGQVFRVDYRMRQRKPGKWEVIDVTIEGVSLVGSFRSQFDEILKTGTTEELIQKLKSKNLDAKNE